MDTTQQGIQLKEPLDISQTIDHSQISQNLLEIKPQLQQSQCMESNPVKVSSSLAMMLAKRFPKGISEEVQKMIEYYENQSCLQIQEIHHLTKENNKLRRKVEVMDKENLHNMLNDDDLKEKRISSLEDKLIQKDKKINELNQEVTSLLTKTKKYKKKLYELELKSPLKNDI